MQNDTKEEIIIMSYNKSCCITSFYVLVTPKLLLSLLLYNTLKNDT